MQPHRRGARSRHHLMVALALSCLFALLLQRAGARPSLAVAARAQSDTPISALIAAIPDAPDTRDQVTITDIARIRQALKVAAPTDPTDRAQKETFLTQLAQARIPEAGGLPFISGLSNVALQGPDLERYLGFLRLDQAASAGSPPQVFDVLRGAFDPAAAAQQIAACADCPPAQQDTFDGVTFFSWGADFALDIQHVLAPPAFDQLGRGGRVAITPSLLLHTNWTDGITAEIAAATGGPSLAQDADEALAAGELDAAGVYSVFITDLTQGPETVGDPAALHLSAEQAAALATTLSLADDAPVLAPYQVVAAGYAFDDSGAPETVLVLIQADETDAQANATILPQRIAATASITNGEPWSQLLPSVDVQVDGRALIVRLPGSRIGAQFLYQRDPLLLHR